MPGGHFLHHLVGDGADALRSYIDLVQIDQVLLDLSHRHAVGVEREHVLIEPGEAPGVLGDEAWLEGPRPIARDGQGDRAVLGEHGLGRRSVPVILLALGFGRPLRVAQVMRELAGQGALVDHLLHLAEQLVQLGHRLPIPQQRINSCGVELRRWRRPSVVLP